MGKRYLEGMFEGWCVDEDKGLIWDEGNNQYEIGEIRALFYFRQWRFEFEGHNGRIRSLKEHLEEKIKRLNPPKIVVDWGDVQERYVHPHFRR